MTTTHTHVVTKLANPYLRCDVCHQPIEGIISFRGQGQPRTCEHQGLNVPCEHLGVSSICPSWGPVDGCQCQEHLGYMPHPPEPIEQP